MKSMLEILVELYGPRLGTADLARALKKTPEHIRNEISAGVFPIRTYKDGDAQSAPRYADVRDVAEYLDRKRDKAA